VIKINRLFDIIKAENIYFNYTNLLTSTHNKLYGVYFFEDSYGPSILLDKSLAKPENRRLHKCILAEELGHHFTVPRTNIFKLYGSCSIECLDKIQQAQDERKALKWASDILIPNVELSRAVSDGCQSVYVLAEWFDVTEWFVFRKLGILETKYRDIGSRIKSRDYSRIKNL
jgi:Zn-dependent peptidase ImmA (M78 family)